MNEKGIDELPSKAEIRKTRKDDLVELCKKFDLNSEGKVAELRERLINYIEEKEEEEEEEIEIVEEEEEEIEEEEEEEEGVYKVKQKPELSDETKKLLAVREKIKRKKPNFKRQEWFRYKRLSESWRKPRGIHSKMRRHYKYRIKMVSVGYGGPKKVKGLHPSGFEEVMVHNVNDLKAIDPKKQAARIGHTVGTKKRIAIEEKADELGIRVLNRGEV